MPGVDSTNTIAAPTEPLLEPGVRVITPSNEVAIVRESFPGSGRVLCVYLRGACLEDGSLEIKPELLTRWPYQTPRPQPFRLSTASSAPAREDG